MATQFVLLAQKQQPVSLSRYPTVRVSAIADRMHEAGRAGMQVVIARGANRAVMPEKPEPGAVLTALTTEHFTLQGARSTTRGEAASRSTVYLASVSSSLVALGFIGNIAKAGPVFRLFTLAVLPPLFFLGVVTFIRLVDLDVEGNFYDRAINRIRHYYLELSGEDARYFMLSGHDDIRGVMSNVGSTTSHRQLLFTGATAIAVINSVVGGAGVALLLGDAAGLSSGAAVGVGAAIAAGLLAAHLLYQRRRGEQVGAGAEVLFPSP